MELNFNIWLSSLDKFTLNKFEEGCILMLPLIDKIAKIRYPGENNKSRMEKFFNDETEKIFLLATGLHMKYDPIEDFMVSNGGEVKISKESGIITISGLTLGELLYQVRCSLLHEAVIPANIEFINTPNGILDFSYTCENNQILRVKLPTKICINLLVIILGMPEYTSIISEFNGRKIKFGKHIILPSKCVGNFEELYQQLIFGV